MKPRTGTPARAPTRRSETPQTTTRAADGRDPQLERWVIAACIAYAAIFTAARIATLPVLLADDAALLLRVQTLSLADASGDPPLAAWLFRATHLLMGNALLGAVTLRYACVAVAFIVLFRAALATLGHSMLAALATGSLLLSTAVAVEMHRDLAQGVLMLAAAAAAWLALVPILRGRAATSHFVLLGLAVGLGGLAAYPSLMVALALALVVSADDGARARCADRRMLLALAVAVALLLPLLVAVGASGVGTGRSGGPPLARLLPFAGGIALAALPMAALWALLRRGEGDCAQAADVDAALLERVLARWLASALPLLAIAALGGGDESLALPLLVPGSLLFFARLRRIGTTAAQLRRFAWVTAAGALVGLIVTIARPEIETHSCVRCAALRDYRPAAQALAQAGAAGALIVGDEREAVANLLVWLPEARGWAREDPPGAIPPDAPGRVCVLLWGGAVGRSGSPAPDWTRALVRTPPGLSLVQNVASPIRGVLGRAPRLFSLSFAVVPAAGCVLPAR